MRAAGVPVHMSFGVATFGRDGRSLDELMRAADRGLYASKRAARGPGLDVVA
jgi:GGDEF domain-containing protein